MAKQLQKNQNEQKSERKTSSYGWPHVVAIGVPVAAVAIVAMLRSCEPAVEPLRPCPTPVAQPQGPKKGDGKCEVDKGEWDPSSKNFDPDSCKICGDDMRQLHETEVNCAMDFHCGNGTVDINETYAAMVQVQTQTGVVDAWGVVLVTESCKPAADNYCEADCPTKEAKATTRRKKEPSEALVSKPTNPAVEACTYGPNKTDLTNRTANAMLGKAGELRKTVGTDGAISVTVNYLVDMDGKPTIKSISTSCGGSPCPTDASTSTIQSITGVNPGAATLGSPPAPCILPVKVTVPSG